MECRFIRPTQTASNHTGGYWMLDLREVDFFGTLSDKIQMLCTVCPHPLPTGRAHDSPVLLTSSLGTMRTSLHVWNSPGNIQMKTIVIASDYTGCMGDAIALADLACL
jgi:hypothetical protein